MFCPLSGGWGVGVKGVGQAWWGAVPHQNIFQNSTSGIRGGDSGSASATIQAVRPAERAHLCGLCLATLARPPFSLKALF